MSGVGIRVRGLSHRYGRVRVLEQLDLDAPPGSYVALMGSSGVGKSTLLALLGGLDRPQSGSVVVGEADLTSLSRKGLAAYRRETVGFVFQHFGLVDVLTAAENLELAMALGGVPPARRRAEARAWLDQVGLASRAKHFPSQLSGGERQRVAIARAMVHRPQLILADEPTGNLDEESAEHVLDLLEALKRADGTTLVVVTHNRSVAGRADICFRMTGGRLAAAA